MKNRKEEVGNRAAQLPEYETPTAVSLTQIRTAEGQGTECGPGQQATIDCRTGYSALSNCAPTGLSAGGPCAPAGQGAQLLCRTGIGGSAPPPNP